MSLGGSKVDDITAHVSSHACVQETMSNVDSSLFLAICDVNLIEVRASDGLSNDSCRCCTNAVCIPPDTLNSKQL